MLGVLRLVLACCVALSHANVALAGYHIGVPAVIVFYILAGYVVGLQWRQIAIGRSRTGAVLAFWRDRMLRLLPTYFAVLALTALVALLARPQSYFLSAEPGIACVLGNLTIIPLNFYPFNGLDRCSLIPVSWSLGLEIQFYLLFPLLLAARPLLLLLGVTSLIIYAAAGAGFIHTDIWGYRLLPGTLFIFLIGTLLAWLESRNNEHGSIVVAGLGCLAGTVAAGMVLAGPQATVNFAFETAVGLALALPLIVLGRRIRRSRLDDLAGMAAYPLFLVHFALLWAFEALMPSWLVTPGGIGVYLVVCLLISLTLAIGIDAPTMRLRRRLRHAQIEERSRLSPV